MVVPSDLTGQKGNKMNYTYFIMNDNFKSERPRRPELGADDYPIKYVLGENGVKILKERTYSEAERAYIEKNAERLANFEFAYNMVYLMKQACGHYEIFQSLVNSESEAIKWLDLMAEEAKTRKCTRCICGW